jgi:ATP-binding cassette subfamily F protein 3
MLDEPTSHLDMHSCDLLIEALNKYEGTLVLVSHDRYFISKTANKIWEIVDQEIKEFKDNYDEWVVWKERMVKGEAKGEHKVEAKVEEKDRAEAEVEAEKTNGTMDRNMKNTPINKELKKEMQKQQKLFAKVEEELNLIKQKIQIFEKDLANPEVYANKEQFLQLEMDYKAALDLSVSLEGEYEEIFLRIMELEEKC